MQEISSDDQIIQNVENTNYLKEIFMMRTISGALDSKDRSTFNCILAADGFDRPIATMASWIEDAKVMAAQATGKSASEFAYLNIDLNVNLEPLSLEESFCKLCKNLQKSNDPSNMAKLRLTLISLVRESKQQELIETWNNVSAA